MIIDSVNMILELPMDKRLKILKLIEKSLNLQKIKIEKLAELIGVLVAACPAVAYGWLYYKELEGLKIRALRDNGYDMKKYITMPQKAIVELHWWENNILTSVNKTRSSIYDLEISSDASLTGWGAT